MRFDLFDAMLQMKKEFGKESELLLSQHESGIAIRLCVFRTGEQYCNGFIIEGSDIFRDSGVFAANIKFSRAIKQLKNSIENKS